MKKGSTQEQVLRASKEIAVKFIEVGRLSPTNFAETFKSIYGAIDATVNLHYGEATEQQTPSDNG